MHRAPRPLPAARPHGNEGDRLWRTRTLARSCSICSTKAFDPELKASPDDYESDTDKDKLRDLQQTTRNTQESYHRKYESAEKVRRMFHNDLNSDAAKKVHRDLKDLGFPTLNDIEAEFGRLADELDVGS